MSHYVTFLFYFEVAWFFIRLAGVIITFTYFPQIILSKFFDEILFQGKDICKDCFYMFSKPWR